MRTIKPVIFILFAVFANQARAIPESTYLTTQDVYLACKQLVADVPGIDFSAGICGGYTIALMDKERTKPISKRMFCIPAETTLKDAIRAMNIQLEKLKSQFDQPAFSILPYALAEQYPCKIS